MYPRKLSWPATVAFLTLLVIVGGIAGHFVMAGEDTRPAKVASPAAKPVKVEAGDPALTRAVENVISESGLAQARVGVVVISAKDGRILYAHDADHLFTPASNIQIYTTALALDLRRPDYRWRTSVYAAQKPSANGIIEGDLVLYGRGAPDLSTKAEADRPSLATFAEELYKLGVREVRGNVIGDESYFRGEQFGIG